MHWMRRAELLKYFEFQFKKNIFYGGEWEWGISWHLFFILIVVLSEACKFNICNRNNLISD